MTNRACRYVVAIFLFVLGLAPLSYADDAPYGSVFDQAETGAAFNDQYLPTLKLKGLSVDQAQNKLMLTGYSCGFQASYMQTDFGNGAKVFPTVMTCERIPSGLEGCQQGSIDVFWNTGESENGKSRVLDEVIDDLNHPLIDVYFACHPFYPVAYRDVLWLEKTAADERWSRHVSMLKLKGLSLKAGMVALQKKEFSCLVGNEKYSEESGNQPSQMVCRLRGKANPFAERSYADRFCHTPTVTLKFVGKHKVSDRKSIIDHLEDFTVSEVLSECRFPFWEEQRKKEEENRQEKEIRRNSV